MPNLNITNIPAPRVPFIDERTGLMAREWYRFFLNLFVLTGSGNNPITLEELQLGPPNQPDLAELLIQINQNIAPQYEDQSGDFLKTLDTAQLMSMMSQFANAEAAIQGAYLQPVVQTGTIANYNLDGSPTAGGVAYGTGPALAVSAAGTLGQVLTSGGAGAPTWATDGGGTVTTVSVVSANGLAGTVATATTTPAITLSTSITGVLLGNGTAISAAVSGTNIKTVNGTTLLGAGDLGTITYAYGGTGLTSYTAGDIIYASAANTVAKLAIGTSGQRLVVAAGLPSWATDTTVGTVTSVAQSFTGGLISVAGSPITSSGTLALTVAGTSGGIPYFSSASTWASSAALAAGSLVLGGGAGVTPATTTTGTGVVTALGVNTGTAGAFVVNGGALGTPASGTVTNLTGTASININGTVGATTPAAGAFTTLTASAQLSIAGNAGFAGVTTANANNAISLPQSTYISWFDSGSSGATTHYMTSNGSLLTITGNTAVTGTVTATTTASSAAVTIDGTNAAGGTFFLVQRSGVPKTYFGSSVSISGVGTANDTDIYAVGDGRLFGGNQTTNFTRFTSTGLAVTGTLSATGVVTFSNYGVGTATFNGSGVISSVSDETWKVKDGAPVDTDAMLNKLEPGYWYYNDEKKETFGKDRQLGFYAQNVNAAIGPEAAPIPEEGKPWGYYDRSVLAVTVLSLQKALATIESLKIRLAALENK